MSQADIDVDGLDPETSLTPLDELKAEFAETLKPSRLFKKFPARSGRLVAEYQTVTKDDIRTAVQASDDEYVLDACLLRILITDPENPLADKNGLVPLGAWAKKPELDPLTFDHRFCDLIGIPKGTPAQIALALFDGNDLMLAEQAGEVAAWSVDVLNESYQDFK